uniref:WW domain-containing protein n=1 Tax=Mesocestoides corti TaxID=53468 RepID=A0A5K3FD49_MESCO
MSGQDSHLFPNKASSSSVAARPSKLALFGRRTSDKHSPSSHPPKCPTFTASPLGRARPSTVVKPFFAAHHQLVSGDEAQRRRYPASQPTTPVRGNQPENSQEYHQLHRSAHFIRPDRIPNTAIPNRRETTGALPQSVSFPNSCHVLPPAGNQPAKTPKSKPHRMENMSVEHLQYLESRLQQLLDAMPSRPPLAARAKSDSGRQSHQPWIASPGRRLLAASPTSAASAVHYPLVASAAPFQLQPLPPPLLLYPPPPPRYPYSHYVEGAPGGGGGGEADPYSLSSASSCYGGSCGLSSSLQDFDRDELYCLLLAVRNMLSMHQQNQQSSSSPSKSSAVDALSVLQHRPFSWYLQKNATAPSSPSSASSTMNLFLDDENADAEGNGRYEHKEEVASKAGSSDGRPRPPLLPAGFRNFSRYLDTKFGPDGDDLRGHHRRRRRETTTDTSVAAAAPSRGKSVTDVRPKISITTCSGDTGPYSDLSLTPEASGRIVPSGKAQHRAPSEVRVVGDRQDSGVPCEIETTWSAPYWSPPLPINSCHQPAPPPPPQARYCPAPPPPPPPPPPNATAACWLRAAANHFATAAAIFAADNAAAAVMAQHQLPPIPPSAGAVAPFAEGVRGRHARRRAPPSPSTVYSQEGRMRMFVPNPTPNPPPSQFAADVDSDEFFVVSDDEQQTSDESLHLPVWGGAGRKKAPDGGPAVAQAGDDENCGLDMLPQDPALILPDQVDFYAQIKDLLELDNNISLPLPAGWAVGVSSSGRRFYVSCAGDGDGGSGVSRVGTRRTTTWQHPVIAPRIPLGWERVEMRRGNCIYYRHLLIPHTQRHHPDLWFPTHPKNVEFEHQSWFFDLRKLQESVSNFDKGNSQLIESYVDTTDCNDEARFSALLKRYGLGELENLLKHLDCRFFRDLHRMVVAFELARIRIVRELFVQHVNGTRMSATTDAN